MLKWCTGVLKWCTDVLKWCVEMVHRYVEMVYRCVEMVYRCVEMVYRCVGDVNVLRFSATLHCCIRYVCGLVNIFQLPLFTAV